MELDDRIDHGVEDSNPQVDRVSDVVLGREQVGLTNLYKDAMMLLANLLEPWDLVAMSQVCKSWYRFISRPEFRARISFPFKGKYKLTPEQFEALQSLLSAPPYVHPHADKLAPEAKVVPQRLVHGAVGSGKTWLAAAYCMHKYAPADYSTRFAPVALLVVVPPTCVQQWSEFFRVYTDLPVLSNYKSSCFFHAEWKKHAPKFRIFITSNITSGTVQHELQQANRPHVIIHDEAHNGIGAHYFMALEVIGFTASLETFEARNAIAWWQVFSLKSEMLRANLPPVEFVCYEQSGYTPAQHRAAIMSLYASKVHHYRDIQFAFAVLTYGENGCSPFVVNRGNKVLKHGMIWDQGADYQALKAQALSRCLEIPKLRQLAAIAETVQKRGEKLIIFDTSQDYVVLLYLFLSSFGFNVSPFSTQYDPSGRANLLTEFAKSGDILIGSIEMLSEGHNITCANNIVFIRYPNKPEIFMQALGRCHRFPQKKTVWIHMITSCQLELKLAMKGLEDGYAQIKRKKYENELAEFTLEAKRKP